MNNAFVSLRQTGIKETVDHWGCQTFATSTRIEITPTQWSDDFVKTSAQDPMMLSVMLDSRWRSRGASSTLMKGNIDNNTGTKSTTSSTTEVATHFTERNLQSNALKKAPRVNTSYTQNSFM
jgi:hypothetical protein